MNNWNWKVGSIFCIFTGKPYIYVYIYEIPYAIYIYEYLGPLAIKILKVVGQRQSKWMWTGQMVCQLCILIFFGVCIPKSFAPTFMALINFYGQHFANIRRSGSGSKSGADFVAENVSSTKETKRRFPYRLSICRPKWLRLADMAGWVLLQQAHLWRVSDSPHTILVFATT